MLMVVTVWEFLDWDCEGEVVWDHICRSTNAVVSVTLGGGL
jgi:hypothetical protein